MKTLVDFHVMPVGLGAYPIILGRPWLRVVNAIQDWRRGTISLGGKTSGRRLFDMDSRKALDEDFEDDDESTDEDSSKVSEVDSDSSSSDEDVNVAFLLVDREFEETNMVAAINEAQEEYEEPYEVIEGLMQPKEDLSKKQDLMVKMLSSVLAVMEKEQYLKMISRFLELFIMPYEEIKGFKGE